MSRRQELRTCECGGERGGGEDTAPEQGSRGVGGTVIQLSCCLAQHQAEEFPVAAHSSLQF